ncbi:MAG: STAS domain-containing protein [bacterium]|jgi:anti-anti-sigma factor|nr:STAS domain-containing protein [bacterium]
MDDGVLDIVTEERGGIFTLILKGTVNITTSPRLRRAVLSAFEKGVQAVLLEITGVSQMDSSALATLVEGMQLAEQTHRHFALAGHMDEKIFHLLQITHLEDLFPLYPSLEQAMQTVSTPPHSQAREAD